MSTTEQAKGYGSFEETARELEQAAADKAGAAADKARRTWPRGMAALSTAVRTRPVTAMLMACAGGYMMPLNHIVAPGSDRAPGHRHT